MLKVGDVVNIISLPIVDAYSLYDPMKRLVRVKSKKVILNISLFVWIMNVKMILKLQ